MFKKRRIAKLITLIMAGVIVILPIVPTASAVDPDATTVYYESESNNTYSTADRTYDDYDNYGKISAEGDVDWWYIVATADGMANFWLGEIPTGCNYNMTLYKGNGTSAIVSSNNTGRTQELIRCHVYAGQVYRLRISSSSGYSADSYYKFRYKRSTISPAEFFTVNVGNDNSTLCGTLSQQYVENMGFTMDLENRTNSLAPFAFAKLQSADIFFVCNHARPGRCRFNNETTNSYLYAKSNGDMTSNCRAVNSLPTNALKEVELVIYMGCNTGSTDSIYGNLVDETLAKGAKCCIGWTVTIPQGIESLWISKFVDYCSQGYNLNVARVLTNNYVANTTGTSEYSSQYYGESPLSRTVLGLQY